MTKIPFGYLFYYLTETEGLTWRNTDFNMRNIVRGMKREAFNGYSDFVIGGETKRYDSSNIETFMPVLFNTIAQKIRETVQGPVSIVPVPSSNMAIGQTGPFRSVELATLLASRMGNGAKVVPALRWAYVRQKAHLIAGVRDPDQYEPILRLVDELDGPVMLFDDVMTSGSQMTACCRVLESNKRAPAFAAVVARTTNVQHTSMLGWKLDELDISRGPVVFG